MGVPEFGGNGWEERMNDADTSSTSHLQAPWDTPFHYLLGIHIKFLLRENTFFFFFFAKMFEKNKIEDIKNIYNIYL